MTHDNPLTIRCCIDLRHQITDLQADLIELARRRGQVQQRAKTNAAYLNRRKMNPPSGQAQSRTVRHGALAYLSGINAVRASEAAAVRIEDYAPGR